MDKRSIFVQGFSITAGKEAKHEIELNKICNYRINALHESEKILCLKDINSIIMKFNSVNEDASIKSMIFIDDEHWLHVNLEEGEDEGNDNADANSDKQDEVHEEENEDSTCVNYTVKTENCLHLGVHIR